MFKSMLALVAAATIAALFVGFVPPPAPAAAKTSASVASPAGRGAGCIQAWPYYEQTCLRDSREPNGTVRAVRVVAQNK